MIDSGNQSLKLTPEVEPLMSHGLFYNFPYFVSGPGNITAALLSMEGQRAFATWVLFCMGKKI